ncbi:SgcJ/EcaC family oxidoreductase [Amycolatopsis cihanbeyliensis]|uniref:Uncharacterized protein (TIGR02246 family) n=1 Tax=Amycolatopsis cihanbeyliensis TaxID=1128664 RepID=A0A542DKY1_AMYCI|nr:SgcJ/EcaC family oxidoreductase [Amycolatopsis cihanbeyliensis]TQJ03757.1 uncharacterized protein (TIGR02246 family) [Amycolatopsis cihanbeyliensis]
MRKKWQRGIGAVASALVLGVTGSTAAATAEPDAGRTGGHDHDLRQIERLRLQQERAWREHDGAAFAATFTPDGDMVTFNGDHLRTRRGIATGMQYYFDNFIPYNQIRMLDEHLRFAGPDLAFAVRTSCIVPRGERDCRDGSLSTNTNVLTQRHGRWPQESFQNTRKFEVG